MSPRNAGCQPTPGSRLLRCGVAVLIAAAWGASIAAQTDPGDRTTPPFRETTWSWPDREGKPLPFANEDELLDFLGRAKIVSQQVSDHGINRPLKLELEADGIRVRAYFRTVDRTWRREAGPDGVWRQLYRDSYIYECAAYELSRALGLDRVPPTVFRRFRGEHGSLQARVESSRMEGELLEQKVQAPHVGPWVKQMMQRQLFDVLINNQDRNAGNMMVDAEWEAWFIDHGRSFLIDPDPERISEMRRTERGLFQALETTDRTEVEKRLDPYLTGPELEALFDRWDRIVTHIRDLERKHGAELVFYDG